MKIVKNSYALSAEYVPSTIVGREEYVKLINDMIEGDGLPSTLIVRGNPGTGKTLIGKSIIQRFKRSKGIYVNCYIHSSDKSIISEIVGSSKTRNIDFSNYSEDKILFNSLQEKNNLVVLDEVHSVKKTHGQVLYLLSRSLELGGPIVKLILLTMEEPEFFLDRSTLSGLGKYNRISLKEYSSEQLYQILADRARNALYEGTYNNESIESCAELTEESGNAREAIELLKNSALLAESLNKTLTGSIVTEASRDFSPPVEDSSLINLEDYELKLLRKLVKRVGSETRFKSSDLKLIDRSILDSRIYRFLRILEDSGLVKKNKIGKGYGGGVENEYSLRVPPFLLLEKISSIEDSRIKDNL